MSELNWGLPAQAGSPFYSDLRQRKKSPPGSLWKKTSRLIRLNGSGGMAVFCAYFLRRGDWPMCQIFSLYSRMVRSEEKMPEQATLAMAIFSHFSWF